MKQDALTPLPIFGDPDILFSYPPHDAPLVIQNTSYSRRVLFAITIGASLATLVSLGSWIGQTGPGTPPVYLLHLPVSLGIPYLLLGAPLALISAPDAYRRIYSWGAVLLALGLSATWCIFAWIDPSGSRSFTQTVLLFGWMIGGTAYEVLLIFLVARS